MNSPKNFQLYNHAMNDYGVQTAYKTLSAYAEARYKRQRDMLNFMIATQDYLIAIADGKNMPLARHLLYKRAHKRGIDQHLALLENRFNEVTTLKKFYDARKEDTTHDYNYPS